MTPDCQLPCDRDCEITRDECSRHCWNWHRPRHKPDWHDPLDCDSELRGLRGGITWDVRQA